MPSRGRGLLILLLAGAPLGCNQEYDNPFAGSGNSVRIPDGADIVFVSNLHGSAADAPREVYAVEDGGGNVTRLTTCIGGAAPCDALEAAIAPDRMRLAVRRGAPDESALVLLDLGRRVEGGLLESNARVGAIDWSPQEILVYSAIGANGFEDLYRMDPTGQNNQNLSGSALVRERRVRIHPTGGEAVYERIEGANGLGAIWFFQSVVVQGPVTEGGPRGEQMPGTPYWEGSDADPDYGPDGETVVFRRLRRATSDRQGEWDVMVANLDGTGLRTVADGPAWRGAPDWGPGGIVFVEVEANQRRLVIVDPGTRARRVILTAPAGRTIDNPRWIP